VRPLPAALVCHVLPCRQHAKSMLLMWATTT
jgi:hypothetical protein